MSQGTKIGWTGATWPIVAGCHYVSPGCSNCWAVRDSYRLMHNPHAKVRQAYAGTVRKLADGKMAWTGLVRTLPERLSWPLHWRSPRRIFVCSQADLFDPAVSFEFIAAAFGVMAMAKQHTFQVLTKRPERALEFFDWIGNDADGPTMGSVLHSREYLGLAETTHEPLDDGPAWPLANVWVGVTVEDQQRADERVPQLLRIQAAKRWLSVEPMLERIELRHPDVDYLEGWYTDRDQGSGDPVQVQMDRVDWIVCGGESAQTRATTRSFDVGWARHLLAQCRAAGVPFFMKQLGTKPYPEAINGPGVATVMRNPLPLPAGRSSRYKFHEPEHWPEDLRVQEFPQIEAKP